MWTNVGVRAIGGSVLFVLITAVTVLFGWTLIFPPEPVSDPAPSKVVFDAGNVAGATWSWITTKGDGISADAAGDVELTFTIASTADDGAVVYLHGPLAESASCFPAREERVEFADIPQHVKEALANAYTRPAAYGMQTTYEGYRTMTDEDALKLVEQAATAKVTFIDYRTERSGRVFTAASGDRSYTPVWAESTCTIPAEAVWSSEEGRRTLSLPAHLSTAMMMSPVNSIYPATQVTVDVGEGIEIPYTTKSLDYSQSGAVKVRDWWTKEDQTDRVSIVLSGTTIAFKDTDWEQSRETRVFWVSLGLAISGSLLLGLMKLAFDLLYPTKREA